jgi:hypothetical protein
VLAALEVNDCGVIIVFSSLCLAMLTASPPLCYSDPT